MRYELCAIVIRSIHPCTFSFQDQIYTYLILLRPNIIYIYLISSTKIFGDFLSREQIYIYIYILDVMAGYEYIGRYSYTTFAQHALRCIHMQASSSKSSNQLTRRFLQWCKKYFLYHCPYCPVNTLLEI